MLLSIKWTTFLWVALLVLLLGGCVVGLVFGIEYGNREADGHFEPARCKAISQEVVSNVCTYCDSGSKKKRCIDYTCYRGKCNVSILDTLHATTGNL